MKTLNSISLLAIILSPAITYLTHWIGAYALILFIPFVLAIWSQKLTKKDLGITAGNWQSYALAIIFPLITFAVIAISAFFAQEVHFNDVTATIPVKFPLILVFLLIDVLITGLFLIFSEEGFFRGVLLGKLVKLKKTALYSLLYTGIVFSIWHIAALLLFPESKLHWSLMIIYLLNAVVVSMIWGIIRIKSGSIFPVVISHAVWNTYAYYLFGTGEDKGALGITSTWFFDPERGLLGLMISLGVLSLLLFLNKKMFFAASDKQT